MLFLLFYWMKNTQKEREKGVRLRDRDTLLQQRREQKEPPFVVCAWKVLVQLDTANVVLGRKTLVKRDSQELVLQRIFM